MVTFDAPLVIYAYNHLQTGLYPIHVYNSNDNNYVIYYIALLHHPNVL